MVFAKNNSRASLQHNGLAHFPPVNITESISAWEQLDHSCQIIYVIDSFKYSIYITIVILKHTVLIGNVGPDQLDILGDVGLGGADPGGSDLQVVQQALGQGGVRVEIDQMWSFLGLEEADRLPVLLDCDAHLCENCLALLADGLGSPELVVPGLGELGHQLLVLL